MSITTYAELQTSVAGWLHRDDLTAIIPDLITLAEKRIFREVRCRVMESALSGTTSTGVLAVPADYLQLKFAYVVATPVIPLSRMSASQLLTQYPLRSASSKPKAIARQGSNFIFGPFPAADTAIAGIYYAQPTAIATSANALFLANPDLYLFATLCEATPYLKDDPRIVIWEAKLKQIMYQLANEDADEYGSGGGLSVQTA